MSLTALLDAEHQLGRLAQALESGDHALWQADALRREALASAELDGIRVAWSDLVVAEIDPELLPEPLRPGTALPLRVLTTGRSLLRGLTGDGNPRPEETLPDRFADDDDEQDEDEIGDVVTAARDAVAEIEAFLNRPQHTDETTPPAAAPALPPLSRDWLATGWRRLTGTDLPALCLDDLETILDEGLRRPGLSGVAAVLYALHRDGIFPAAEPLRPRLPDLPETMARTIGLLRAENTLPGPGWRFARLLAPWLIQRSHGLPFPAPWLSPALLAVRKGYAAAATGRTEDWTAWLYPTLAAGFERERRRLRDLAALLLGWERRYTAKRRWQASREALRILVEQPALTTLSLQSRRGITRRAAQMMVKDLHGLDILERVHLAKGREWWLAREVTP